MTNTVQSIEINNVVIGVGSNINPYKNIFDAQKEIASMHELIKTSSFLKTKPVGCTNQDDFINGAFLVHTKMDSGNLKSWLKTLEEKLGRVKTENNNGPRIIDLDILVWNGVIVDSDVYDRDFLRGSILELLPEFSF